MKKRHFPRKNHKITRIRSPFSPLPKISTKEDKRNPGSEVERKKPFRSKRNQIFRSKSSKRHAIEIARNSEKLGIAGIAESTPHLKSMASDWWDFFDSERRQTPKASIRRFGTSFFPPFALFSLPVCTQTTDLLKYSGVKFEHFLLSFEGWGATVWVNRDRWI